MAFTPINGRVVVSPIHDADRTSGGIFIPEQAKSVPMVGEVVHAGAHFYHKDGQKHPSQIKVGDKVLYAKYAGSEIKLDGEDMIILLEEDIFGILS